MTPSGTAYQNRCTTTHLFLEHFDVMMQHLLWEHALISAVILLAQAKDLVAQLLVVDPSQRLSAREALAHPWVQASVHLQAPHSVTSSTWARPATMDSLLTIRCWV